MYLFIYILWLSINDLHHFAVGNRPFDVVKTRMQQARDKTESTDNTNTGSLQMMQAQENINAKTDDDDDSLGNILKQLSQEGNHVFFSGWYERCLRSCVQFGVTLSLFEVLNLKAAELGML